VFVYVVLLLLPMQTPSPHRQKMLRNLCDQPCHDMIAKDLQKVEDAAAHAEQFETEIKNSRIRERMAALDVSVAELHKQMEHANSQIERATWMLLGLFLTLAAKALFDRRETGKTRQHITRTINGGLPRVVEDVPQIIIERLPPERKPPDEG
jgi:DNA repair exonuclease SbcCD ATPase subunit